MKTTLSLIVGILLVVISCDLKQKDSKSEDVNTDQVDNKTNIHKVVLEDSISKLSTSLFAMNNDYLFYTKDWISNELVLVNLKNSKSTIISLEDSLKNYYRFLYSRNDSLLILFLNMKTTTSKPFCVEGVVNENGVFFPFSGERMVNFLITPLYDFWERKSKLSYDLINNACEDLICGHYYPKSVMFNNFYNWNFLDKKTILIKDLEGNEYNIPLEGVEGIYKRKFFTQDGQLKILNLVTWSNEILNVFEINLESLKIKKKFSVVGNIPYDVKYGENKVYWMNDSTFNYLDL